MDLNRLSLNTITVKSLTFPEVVETAVRFGIPAIAPWRDLFDDLALDLARRMTDDAGLMVSSLCRGGMFTSETAQGRRVAIADNQRAVDQAAALGAQALVLVCGPVVGKDVSGSFSMIVDGIGEILPYAASAGVRLAIEPLHPMMAADRSAICTLQQARRVISDLAAPHLGACIDAYHVWWDADLDSAIRDLSGSVLGFHVSDWVTPIIGQLSSRGMMGDGCIDLPRVASSVDSAGYSGFVEVEILSDYWWSQPPEHVVEVLVKRFSLTV